MLRTLKKKNSNWTCEDKNPLKCAVYVKSDCTLIFSCLKFCFYYLLQSASCTSNPRCLLSSQYLFSWYILSLSWRPSIWWHTEPSGLWPCSPGAGCEILRQHRCHVKLSDVKLRISDLTLIPWWLHFLNTLVRAWRWIFEGSRESGIRYRSGVEVNSGYSHVLLSQTAHRIQVFRGRSFLKRQSRCFDILGALLCIRYDCNSIPPVTGIQTDSNLRI